MSAQPGRRRLAALASLLWALLLAPAQGQTTRAAPPEPQDCGSVVLLKCDKPETADKDKARSRQQMESRRTNQSMLEFERIIIEGDSERRSPEDAINRALSRPLVREGEQTFAIGESAQCTCMNICPPPPFPCCQCTDRVGSRHSTSPGWAPTR
jgi:hypothetical protein